MHFHLPKPLHGWREFAGEVGIIVVGVLIALAFDQAVERIRWNGQVHAARAAIHREMAFDLGEFSDRIRIAPCMNRQIAEAQRRIDVVASTGSTPIAAANLQPPGRLILTGDYEAQQAAQNLVHFPAAELSAFGVWYDQVRDLRAWDAQENSTWSDLSILDPGHSELGPQDLALLRRDLQTAKYLELLTILNSKREIKRARELGVSPDPSRVDYVQVMCGNRARQF